MKKMLIPILLVLSLVVAGCIPCTIGSGKVVEKTATVADFHSISLEGSGNIYVTQGEEAALKIEAEDNIIPTLKFTLKQGELTISRKQRCITPTEPINFYVTMKDVKKLAVSGSGRFIGETDIVSDSLELDISGSGKFDLDVESGEINSRIDGSGEIELSGSATKHEFTVIGSGKLKGFNLETETSNIKISGSGNAEVWATNELDVNIAGSGNIRYKGEPKVSQSISGSGSVKAVEE